MEKEPGFVIEWEIQNLSHWCAEVHGNSIASPKVANSYCDSLELYPRGISGQERHLLVRFCGTKCAFSADLFFIGPDESFLFTQKVNAEENKTVLELPPGPKFEEVLAQIVRNEDQITVRCRIKIPNFYVQRIFTTINVIKISLKLDLKGIFKLKPNVNHYMTYINYSRFEEDEGLFLLTQFNRETIQFMIESKGNKKNAISIDICMSLLNSDDSIESHEEKKNVFSNKAKWTFSDTMIIKDLVERRNTILLDLEITSRNMIRSHVGSTVSNNSTVSIVNFSEEKSLKSHCTVSALPVTCTQTEDSATLLIKDLWCLFQDQDFSDLQLKCGDVSIPVHKNILSARSPVFKRLLLSDMKEAASGEVDIGDIDTPTLIRFLAFLYSGHVEDLQGESALKLYYAADKYEVLSLKRKCCDFLLANVSISNVCEILSFADRHQDEELSTVSKNFILDNYNAVLKSKEWDTLRKSEPLLAVNTLTHFAVNDRVRKHDPY